MIVLPVARHTFVYHTTNTENYNHFSFVHFVFYKKSPADQLPGISSLHFYYTNAVQTVF